MGKYTVEVTSDGEEEPIIRGVDALCLNDVLEMMPERDSEVIKDILTTQDLLVLLSAYPDSVWWQMDKISARLDGLAPDDTVAHLRIPLDDEFLQPVTGNIRIRGQLVFNKTPPPQEDASRNFAYFMPTVEVNKWLAGLRMWEADIIRGAICQLMNNMVTLRISHEVINCEEKVGTNATLHYLRHLRDWKYPGYLKLAPTQITVAEQTPDGSVKLVDNVTF
jgi:hypothetical protein